MVLYVCEICKVQYENLIDAQGCEERGVQGDSFSIGQVFFRSDINHEDPLMRSLIVLKETKPRGRDAHFLTYEVGQITPSDGLPYSYDFWCRFPSRSVDITKQLQGGQLQNLTPEDLQELVETLSSWQLKIEESKKDIEPDPYKQEPAAQILKSLPDYNMTIETLTI